MKQELPDSNFESKNGLAVEQILRLKRAERPSREVWNGFDEKLHRRIFETAVKRRESRLATWLYAIAHSRMIYAASATMAVAVSVGIFVSRGSSVVSSPAPAIREVADMVVSVEAPAPARRASGRESFVADRLSGSNSVSDSFRKVMASQAMFVSTSGSTRYVADQVGSSSRGVLSASTSF